MARKDINYDSRWVVGAGRKTNPPHIFHTERNILISTYWGAIPEKHFTKTLAEVDQLFAQCTTGNGDRILIEVINIDKPATVNVVWKKYDNVEVSKIIATNPTGNNFYVFDKSFYDVTNADVKEEPDGIKFGKEERNEQVLTTNTLGVRLYKKKVGTKFVFGIIVNAAVKNGISVIYLDSPGGAAGEPPGSGVEIPVT